jgi:glycosyltransferase 2 family protein
MKKTLFLTNRNTLAKIAAICITIILIAILFTQISLEDIIQTLRQINPVFLLAGFLLYVGCYLFRTLRFYYLLDEEISFRELFPIICLHNLINQILPAKTGELSYIYLIKKIHDRTIGEGIATLFLARMFDVISISVLFLVSFIFVLPSLTTNRGVVYTVIIILGVFIGILFLFLYKARFCLKIVSAFLSFIHAGTTKTGDFILRKGAETIPVLERARSGGKYSYLVLFGLSLCIWGALYSFTIVLVTAMNIHLSLPAMIFACSFGFMTAILPVQGIGNFGTFEAGWTAGFLSVGLPAELAISTGFSYHIINLLFNVLLGVYGYFSIHRAGLKRSADTNE